MAFKIRSSKFRHVYGSPFRKEQSYENLRITRNAHDSSFCAVNPKNLAVVTESAGGGAFVVLPVERVGVQGLKFDFAFCMLALMLGTLRSSAYSLDLYYSRFPITLLSHQGNRVPFVNEHV